MGRVGVFGPAFDFVFAVDAALALALSPISNLKSEFRNFRSRRHVPAVRIHRGGAAESRWQPPDFSRGKLDFSPAKKRQPAISALAAGLQKKSRRPRVRFCPSPLSAFVVALALSPISNLKSEIRNFRSRRHVPAVRIHRGGAAESRWQPPDFSRGKLDFSPAEKRPPSNSALAAGLRPRTRFRLRRSHALAVAFEPALSPFQISNLKFQMALLTSSEAVEFLPVGALACCARPADACQKSGLFASTFGDPACFASHRPRK